MSNERFKFRVWDKAEKNYGGFPFHLSQFGELERVSIAGTLLDTDSNRYVVEQCTGLKDKNGKLIFEGDVVSFDGVKMLVEWSEKSCRWVLRYADKKHHFYWETMSMCPPAEDYYPNEYRIIGNIHEMEVEW